MKSLNCSTVRIEPRTNDKTKLTNKINEVDVLAHLLRIHITDDNKGVVTNQFDWPSEHFKLPENKSKQEIRDEAWSQIGKVSKYKEQWSQLL